ncbi:sensor histidine kinase [Ramlibacter rhizophilus]|uniref:sensor histidine kinase n=1 Tax=Ramlibacter rhizophilus TaxID=1781167 RepID=UPI0014327C0D|nr:HAMP domain-containing sensor histidine kinase [Ramlibacter rhizophilus]
MSASPPLETPIALRRPELAGAARRYGTAALIVAGAAVLRWLLQPVAGSTPPYITFYFAVLAAAALGGLGPGLAATALGAALGFTLGRLEGYQPAELSEPMRLLLFVLLGIGASLIAGRMHRALGAAHETAERFRASSEALALANERLRETDRNKNRFMAVLAHELRNPLMPIRNALTIMAQGDPQRTQRMLQVIARQVGHLESLVTDLLDVTRIDTDKLTLHRQPMDLRELVRQAADDYAPLLAARGLALSAQVPDAPVPLHGDPARLAQVLGNLLSNSLKFTPPGGEVRVRLEREAGQALLQVEDTGCGIPAEALPHIFDAFAQGEHERSEGLGLGLTLVKRLVEMHGGQVQATSEGQGRGSRFVLVLRLEPPAPG